MTKKKILVADDEKKLVEVVSSYLKSAGFDVIEAYSGQKALDLFNAEMPELIVLDLMLPDISGEEVCRRIRDNSNTPVIMLTAKVEEENILEGLRMGADDYVTKPFSPRQLVARVEAVLRRTSGSMESCHQLSFNKGSLIINDEKHEVKANGKAVNLTPNEYSLLVTLAKSRQKTFTREELVCIAFGDDYEGYDRTVDTHIKNLRQKIEEDAKNPKYIITVYGIGYRFGGE